MNLAALKARPHLFVYVRSTSDESVFPPRGQRCEQVMPGSSEPFTTQPGLPCAVCRRKTSPRGGSDVLTTCSAAPTRPLGVSPSTLLCSFRARRTAVGQRGIPTVGTLHRTPVRPMRAGDDSWRSLTCKWYLFRRSNSEKLSPRS